MASVTNNATGKAGNGLGPRTQIIVTDAAVANDAALTAIIDAAGQAGQFINFPLKHECRRVSMTQNSRVKVLNIKFIT